MVVYMTSCLMCTGFLYGVHSKDEAFACQAFAIEFSYDINILCFEWLPTELL